jgi:hypothetical protein
LPDNLLRQISGRGKMSKARFDRKDSKRLEESIKTCDKEND